MFLAKHFLLGTFRQLLGSEAVNIESSKFLLSMHNYYLGKVKKFQLDIFNLKWIKVEEN